MYIASCIENDSPSIDCAVVCVCVGDSPKIKIYQYVDCVYIVVVGVWGVQ